MGAAFGIRKPTANEKQYMEDLYNNGATKKQNAYKGVRLNRFDYVLTGRNFQQAFPRSTQVKKDSASPTKVYKTTIGKNKFYVKSFDLPHHKIVPGGEDQIGALLYEKEVYRYIRHKAAEDKEVRKHFIQMPLSVADRRNNRGYIFTQDTGGVPLYLLMSSKDKNPLEKYFQDTDHAVTARYVANIFTQLLYVISLMEKIGLVHNDLHFGNILVVRDDVSDKEYTIYGQEFRVRDHPYSLVVYDFDMGSIVSGFQNPFRQKTCREYGRCKDFQSTDKYVWLVHLLVSPDKWKFANDAQTDLLRKLVNTFKRNLVSTKTPQQEAVKTIQDKYALYKQNIATNNRGQKKQKYPFPIFHASCVYEWGANDCSVRLKPLSGRVLAQAWNRAVQH